VRTTLTLDPEVERLISDEVHRTRRPFKQVVNDAIRRGLAPRVRDEPQETYRITVHRTKLRPGIDPTSMNRLADELDDEGTIEKETRNQRSSPPAKRRKSTSK
jgi:hypothetical protein